MQDAKGLVEEVIRAWRRAREAGIAVNISGGIDGPPEMKVTVTKEDTEKWK